MEVHGEERDQKDEYGFGCGLVATPWFQIPNLNIEIPKN
jgi:hypothetical protein